MEKSLNMRINLWKSKISSMFIRVGGCLSFLKRFCCITQLNIAQNTEMGEILTKDMAAVLSGKLKVSNVLREISVNQNKL